MKMTFGASWMCPMAVALGAGLLSHVASAVPVPISSVVAGTNGSPPYDLQSVTVGAYTANRAELRVGTTTALPGGTDTNNDFFGTWPAPYNPPAPDDNFDLNDILARNTNPNPIIVKSFGGIPLWMDINGADPDFFIFESASGEFGDTNNSVQAILPGGTLGQAVNVTDTATWGATGLSRVGNPNNNQSIRGISFAITDLLDDAGVALTNASKIEGLQINSMGLDPSLVAAVGVPEPSALMLLLAVAAGAAVSRNRSKSGT